MFKKSFQLGHGPGQRFVELLAGFFDVLFQADGKWTLVEFKTDYVKDQGALETLLTDEDYIAQVSRYLGAAKNFLGARPRPVLCFLNYAGAVHSVTERW